MKTKIAALTKQLGIERNRLAALKRQMTIFQQDAYHQDAIRRQEKYIKELELQLATERNEAMKWRD